MIANVERLLSELVDSIETVEEPYPGVPSYLVFWKRQPNPEVMDGIEEGRLCFWQRFGKYESRITALQGQRVSVLTLRLGEEKSQVVA